MGLGALPGFIAEVDEDGGWRDLLLLRFGQRCSTRQRLSMSEAEADPYAGTLRYSTAALLAPVSLGNQLFLVLYGIYLSKHCHYCLSPLYTKLPQGVKATLWLVCLLVTVYAGISVADTTYWMGASVVP